MALGQPLLHEAVRLLRRADAAAARRFSDVARELHLDWNTVKDLEKQYMREQLRRVGTPAPKVIGIDEISIRKGHTYRIVVSDLVRRRPIWFGGQDRSEKSLDRLLRLAGSRETQGDPARRHGHVETVPQLHEQRRPCAAGDDPLRQVPRHAPSRGGLGQGAQERVRPPRRARIVASSRARSTRCSRTARISPSTAAGRSRSCLAANKRLNIAYLLKESFGQLWDYRREAWARRFFENWKAALRWQRLKPYEKFAAMIDRHWDGIAAYCRPENKVSLGFVEGLNNKIRVIQRRAYGLRDEEYLRLKILTCMLPEISATAKGTHTLCRRSQKIGRHRDTRSDVAPIASSSRPIWVSKSSH